MDVTIIDLYDETKENKLATYKDICLARLHNPCKKHLPAFGFYQFCYKSEREIKGYDIGKLLSPEQELLLLTAFRHFWHFNEIIPEPKKIVKDRGVWYDFSKISGFDFYSSCITVRLIDNHNQMWVENFPFKKLEKCIDNKEKSCLEILKFCFDENYSHSLASEHSVFDFTTVDYKEYKFNELITKPNSKPMSVSNYEWRNFNPYDLAMHIWDTCHSYYYPGNTK